MHLAILLHSFHVLTNYLRRCVFRLQSTLSFFPLCFFFISLAKGRGSTKICIVSSKIRCTRPQQYYNSRIWIRKITSYHRQQSVIQYLCIFIYLYLCTVNTIVCYVYYTELFKIFALRAVWCWTLPHFTLTYTTLLRSNILYKYLGNWADCV